VRVLFLTHGPSVPGGVFEEVVEAAGHHLERWDVPAGGSPPPAAHDAIMAFGGSMHPDEDDRHDWLAAEEAFLREALADRVPLLGVCLGGQMIARAAGAQVGRASSAEIGWHEVELTPAGRADPVLGVLPPRFAAFEWHRYAFGVPGGGTELARSDVCTQVFRLGRAWALQFHAEVTRAMIHDWAAEAPGELPTPAAGFLAEADRRIERWNELGRALCAAFLEEAARGDARPAATSLTAET
jgi:GMP synthase-like glutamine amidotransferase